MRNTVERTLEHRNERREALDVVMAFHPAPTPAELAVVIAKYPRHAGRIREVAALALELAVITGARRGDAIEVPTEEEIQKELKTALGGVEPRRRRRPDRDRSR